MARNDDAGGGAAKSGARRPRAAAYDADRAFDAKRSSSPAPSRARTALAIVASDAVIDEVAAEIRKRSSAALLEFAFTVGQIVLQRFYAGGVDAWRARGPSDASLRRLAERLGAAARLGAAGIYRCVAVHLVLRRLGPVSEWTHITPSHVRAVLALSDGEQEKLLHEAEADGWNVRRLEAAVRNGRAERPRRRRRAPGFERAVLRLERIAQDDRVLFRDITRAREIDREKLEDLYGRVLRLRERLELLQRVLSPRRLRPPEDGAGDGG